MQLKSLIDEIDRLLPQTQCGRCHYAGCRPYAKAIAFDEADINQCPPGGNTGIRLLAKHLGVEAKALNTAHGEESTPKVAEIVEADCIGCAKCIQVCPVDAIIGAQKFMHTIIGSECTGCELCVAACPVDCIRLNEVGQDDPRRDGMDTKVRQQIARHAKYRYIARQNRLHGKKMEQNAQAQKKRQALQALRQSLRESIPR